MTNFPYLVPIEIDWMHPLAEDLFIAEFFHSSNDPWNLAETDGLTTGITGAPVWDSSTEDFPQLTCDGDDYTTYGEHSYWDGATNLTIAGWMRRASAGSVMVFGRGVETATGRFNILAYWDGNVYFQVDGDGYGGWIALNDANWHHYALTYDGGGATKKRQYIDGIAQSSSDSGVPTSLSSATNSFSIGFESPEGGRYSDGDHGPTFAWHRTLSSEEIWQLYDPATRWSMLKMQEPLIYSPAAPAAAFRSMQLLGVGS